MTHNIIDNAIEQIQSYDMLVGVGIISILIYIGWLKFLRFGSCLVLLRPGGFKCIELAPLCRWIWGRLANSKLRLLVGVGINFDSNLYWLVEVFAFWILFGSFAIWWVQMYRTGSVVPVDLGSLRFYLNTDGYTTIVSLPRNSFSLTPVYLAQKSS
uniref:Protein kinase, putative n=1 Tax=Medicago truncatula TaxID=3880 RepID=Q2HUC5_MEDTR|nr:Protein kinase, putative [Medicago truncatula]